MLDILIPTCNRSAALAATLATLTAQTYRNFRVVIA
ncbi:MAG: glycosyltransferase, partial [Dehalococcoidia bacterium]|nr:glycosyltransferase [Dehalococcoidia bacterium]